MFKSLVLLVAVASVWGGVPRGEKQPTKPFRSIPETRIIGGHDVDISDYPYQLMLAFHNMKYCGATLIGTKWAVTRALCTSGQTVDVFDVVAGSTDLTGGQFVKVAAYYQHPLFDRETLDYDVSVLKLAEDITPEYGSPIALHDAGYIAEEGANATITGWATGSSVLKAVVVAIVSNEACNDIYGGGVTDAMVCAGNLELGNRQGVCNSDKGGPLVVDGKLYGVVSWGSSCEVARHPVVNSRVSHESIRTFVRNVTGI